MKILVLNSGSSSLKFHLFDTTPEAIAANADKLLAQGNVERVSNMVDALGQVFRQLGDAQIDAVGHRIVHGGDRFFESTLITDEVEHQIEELSSLAPLHNPHNLEAYRAAREHLPGVPHVAVFDTAFHHTLPPYAYIYALPYEYLTEKRIRRYGFHGISHRSVSWRFAQVHGKKRTDYRLITCHLGNGCSLCAIDHGRSVDTSMGFTPLEGLIMGSRSGDVDAGAILHLITHEKEDPAAISIGKLNSASGSAKRDFRHFPNDMPGCASRRGGERQFTRGPCGGRVLLPGTQVIHRRVPGGLPNGADALIFTAGIGENSPSRFAAASGAPGSINSALHSTRTPISGTATTTGRSASHRYRSGWCRLRRSCLLRAIRCGAFSGSRMNEDILRDEEALQALITGFEDGTTGPIANWHHRHHIAVAACYIFEHARMRWILPCDFALPVTTSASGGKYAGQRISRDDHPVLGGNDQPPLYGVPPAARSDAAQKPSGA